MTTWMDLEHIILSEMLDRERQIAQHLTYMWNLRNKTKQKLTQIQTTNGYLTEGRG